MIESFTEEQKVAFLKFTWGRTRLPTTSDEFAKSHLFQITKYHSYDAVVSNDIQLPKSHTCFFTLDLPPYSTKEIMHERLLFAISECGTIDDDYEVNAFGDDSELENDF